MSNITLKVNGSAHTVDIDPSTPLLYILRNDLGLQGPRFGCGLGQCGACTVIINGAAMRSCITPTSAVKGEITTLEGLAKEGTLHPLQQAWIDEQVPQCGFCQNGQIMTAKVLLDRNPNPTDAQIREGMAGTLCRCMTYYRIQAAIKRAATLMAAAGAASGKGGVSMTTFTNIPKQVEELLEEWNGTISRRNFLKSSGLLVVSFSAAAVSRSVCAPGSGELPRLRVRIPTPTSDSSIRGSSFTRTTRRPSTSARRTVARAPAPPSGR